MKKKRIVFIGDSITEWGTYEDPEQMGTGYVRLLHDYLQTAFPTRFEIINKGISGNRVTDLEKRWEKDIIETDPDILSISIGVNDVWRQLDNPDLKQVYPEDFEKVYDRLLKHTQQKLDTIVLLMEPTIIEEDVNSLGNQKLKAYAEIVNRLARKYQAILVPTHQDFMKYLKSNSGYPLTIDGIHMNSAGNMLMASCWMKAASPILNNCEIYTL